MAACGAERIAVKIAARANCDAALIYAEHGDPVFPVWYADGDRCGCRAYDCASPAKHPIASCTPRGLKDATTDPTVLEHWWSLFPRAGVAMRTGITSTVVDVDPAKGGAETLARLEAKHGRLPVTARVLTGGGGWHLHFAPVPGLGNSAGRIGPGVDVRGEDGYVLVPPSGHVSGGIYRDDLDAPLYEVLRAAMPPWLLALASSATSANDNGSAPHRTGEEWAARLAGAAEGQRRAVALEIAGHFLGRKIPAAEVEEILLGFAARCIPPFPEREARELARDLARRDQAKPHPSADSAPVADGLGLVTLGEILAEPEDARPYVVENRLSAGGLGLLAAKPKVGKSTTARCLALSVARREPWLGFATTQGPVIYLALEEKREEVAKHFRALGATAADPIFVLCASAPADALARLRYETLSRRPALIIIDPLFRFVRVDDGNDYATMTAALEPLLTLARETGAHVLLVHHLGKGERSDGDNVLGSTAIFGAVDSALLMKRTERYRTIQSVQRYGPDLEETVVELDPETRDVSAGGTREAAELAEAARLILEFLAKSSAPVTEAEMDGAIECRRQIWKKALRDLVGTGKAIRTGRGGKADPFKYSGSLSIHGNQGTGSLFPDLSPDPESKDAGSQVPYREPVPGVPAERGS